MKIQLSSNGLTTDNNQFIAGHLYQHAFSGQIYLCASQFIGGSQPRRYLISLEDGISRPILSSPPYYVDITNQVSLQEVKK